MDKKTGTMLHYPYMFLSFACYPQEYPMKQTDALIERIVELNADFQRLHLSFEDSLGRIKPGQSLLVQPSPIMHPYLREQWWPVSIKGDFVIVERPTHEQYAIGQVLNVLGYVGEAYRFRRNLKNVLLIAYNTLPTPLLMTIPWLLGNQISVTLVLAGSAQTYNTRHIDERVEIILGDSDFTWPNQVMNAGWADQVFVVVNDADEATNFAIVYEKFEQIRASIPANYLFGVFRPPLPCGAGACSACWLALKTGDKLVCNDGPAFDLTQMIR
jgi:hypothetical protein